MYFTLIIKLASAAASRIKEPITCIAIFGLTINLFYVKHVQESILFSILQIGKSRNYLKSTPAQICNLITVFLFPHKEENQRARGLMSEMELNNETDAGNTIVTVHNLGNGNLHFALIENCGDCFRCHAALR